MARTQFRGIPMTDVADRWYQFACSGLPPAQIQLLEDEMESHALSTTHPCSERTTCSKRS
jgi:hypothetical protein